MIDLSRFSDDARRAAALQIQEAKDFQLPELSYFNSGPCPRHETPAQGAQEYPPCRQCGIVFRKHQNVGVAWSFMVGKGLIADSVGTGKTVISAGLLAMLKEYGELDAKRAVVVCRSGNPLMQWQAQLQRMLPTFRVAASTGTRQERIERYLSQWEVLLIGYHMLIQDYEMIQNFNVRHLLVDDVDALRNPENRTAYCIKQLAYPCDRVLILTGTPLQKRLTELHSVLEPVGGLEIFGPASVFRQRYVREEAVRIKTRRKREIKSTKIVGYKNLDEFARKIRPIALRRTASDIDDVNLPVIQPQSIYLDLYPIQKQKYKELKRGVLKVIKDQGKKVSLVTAKYHFMIGAKICTGMAAMGEEDAPNTAVKLDWLEDKLVDGDLSDEKVVVFLNFKNSIRAMKARLDRAGVGHEVIWGEELSPQKRYASQERFWNDPKCRVLMGTTSIEQSLNLQCARHLVNVDTILNPARMQQLAGRIRRDGSSFNTVYVHNLYTNGTQEEKYLPLLEREQALADAVWGEKSELYDSLPPLALMELIGRSSL